MTDALDPNLRAEVAAEFECTGLDGCMYDDHDWKCFVQKRPAVEALIAKVWERLAALEADIQRGIPDGQIDYGRTFAKLQGDRDTLRRELAEARGKLGEIHHEAGVLRMRVCNCDGGAAAIHSIHCPAYLGAGARRALTPKGATDGE